MIKERMSAGIVDFVHECARVKLVKIMAWVLLASLIVIVLGMDPCGEPPALLTH
jgi:hypothetical protein